MVRLEIEFEHALEGHADLPAGARDLMARAARAACALEGLDGVSASVRITDEAGMRALNRAMRGVDQATDVLSFPSVHYRGRTARDARARLRREVDPQTGLAHLGDIAISLPRALAQGAAYGHGARRELAYLVAHAMLHLMGHDHEDEGERRRMRALEERVMAAVGTDLAKGRDKA